jgi:hypothetical protein
MKKPIPSLTCSSKLVAERERAYMRAVARWEPVIEAAKVSEKMTDNLRKHARRLWLEVKTTYDAMSR